MIQSKHFRFMCLLTIKFGALLYFATATAQAGEVFSLDPQAEPAADTAMDELTEMSLEDLMNLEVTSVSKQKQKVSEAPAAVSVITEEEIRRSGMTSLPEMLRMVPGLDVAQINAHTWAIASRGFNNQFGNKLLVMVDGRSVYNTLFSGVYWDTLDYPLEDLERIEVIRGPGATLWGSNAVNGVINITTKSARDTQGWLFSGLGSNSEGIGAVRYGGQMDDETFYRVYTKYREVHDFPLPDGSEANDGWDSPRAGFRIDRYTSPNDTLTLQGDIYGVDGSEMATLVTNTPPFSVTRESSFHGTGGNVLGRWSHVISPDSDMSLQVYYDRIHRHDALLEYDQQTFDVDFMHRFQLGQRQEIIWGVGLRYQPDQVKPMVDYVEFDPEESYQLIASAFVQDDITLVPDRLHLILGSKFEQNNKTGFDIQPSARMVYTPNERNSLWGSISRGVRTPSRFEDDVTMTFARFPMGPGPIGEIVYSGSNDLKSEELIAYEAGYRVQATSALSLDLAVFFNDYDDLSGVTAGTPFFQGSPPPPRIIFPLTAVNNQSAETYGAELAANWNISEDWRLAASYTWIRLMVHGGSDDDEAFNEGSTPRNQFQIRSYYNITRDLEFNAALYYVDRLSEGDVPAYMRLDLGLTWHPNEDLAVSIGVQNLCDPAHLEFSSGRGISDSSEVPRTFYGQLTWRF